MHVSLLQPAIKGLEITNVQFKDEQFLVAAKSTGPAAICPCCQQPSDRVHSYYGRKVADLPWAGISVLFHLQVRRFFCGNRECQRRVFCERLLPHVAVYARRTQRQQQHLCMLAVAMGGELTARLLPKLGLAGSPAMLLNHIRAMHVPLADPVRVLGLDDWAKRKGQTYGTILVDLEQSQVIELLADRTTESVADWLAEHPQIEIISRDRFVNYAQAAAQAAPAAVQVVDRFHLLRNLTEALQRMLDGLPTVLRDATLLTQEQVMAEVSVKADLACAERREPPSVEPINAGKWVGPERQPPMLSVAAQFQEVKALHAQGLSQRAIARRTGLHRRTVRRYVLHDDVPVRALSPQSTSTATPYLAYMQQRLAAGCDNYTRLHAELAALGYQGSYASLRRAVHSLALGVNTQHTTGQQGPPVRPISARQAARLLVRVKESLSQEELHLRTALCRSNPAVATACQLAQSFYSLVRQRSANELDAWLKEAHASAIPELRNFAEGLVRDYSAVKAALTLPWSNRPVEGHVNKLKLLKRQMYGRAKLDLLQQRLVHAL